MGQHWIILERSTLSGDHRSMSQYSDFIDRLLLREGLLQRDYSRFCPAIYSLRRITPWPHEDLHKFILSFDEGVQDFALEYLDDELPVEQQPSPLYLP